MYSFELFEAPKNIVVLYAGRFQPFHKGHRAVYEYLVKKFGRDAVYISTSNKTDNDKSPFTFSDKAYFMQIQGIPMDRVRETNQPYQNPELVKTFDPENTALIVAVSDKDKDRFGKIGFKKDGSLSFFQDMPNELGDMAPISQHGYVMTVPTFDFNVYGKPMRSATEVRAMYRAANEQVRREIIKDLFGKWTQEAEQIMNAKLKEDIMPASQGTISPVHESWSKKYKKSIDCSNPKGFSQKAHCAGRKARQGSRKTKSQSVSENLEGRMIDLTKNFPTYKSLIGKITKENPTKVTIQIVQADGPGNVKVGDELRIATNYIKRLPITENHHHTDIPSMLEKFLPIAMQELGISKLPGIRLTKHLKPHGTQASFGMYNPDDGKIYLAIADRHPVDILRTLAHELVHFSQDGKHELDANSGKTGSSEENEANSVAGIIMRKFNNEFPDAIKSEPLVVENKKKDSSVKELEQTLRNPHSYSAIDHTMQSIARKYKIDAKELHDRFVKHHGTIPDNWVKKLEEFVTANYGIGKTPGVLAKVGPKGQVPRARLHVNVPKKTAIKLGIPHTHLNEVFDAPYPMTWEHDEGESHNALVKLPDGGVLTINFYVEYGDEGQEEWIVEFWRDNTLDVTGTGDQQRIFATVLSAIQQFIKIENPERIKFSAAKQTGDMTPNASRTSLYNKLVQRFANSLGYNVKTTDHALNTVYDLERLREGVAEGRENFQGLNILLQKDDEEVYVKTSAGKKELGHVLFDIEDGYLIPKDLEVDERYQGQGIAATMYDYVKSKGYKIRRSHLQTDAGAAFWRKHRPEQNVWEQGVAESTYNVSDFKINAYESMSDFRKWMRGPKTNDRGMTRHIVDIYENIVVQDNKLTESSQSFLKRKQEAKAFSAIFKQYDERERVQINLGNKIALLSSTVIPDDNSSRIELSGFTTPKKIVKINLDNAGKIDSIKFDDGSTFPEASEFTTVGGVNITNTIFFPNASSASKAHTAIWMYISNLEGKGWTVEHYMSECVAENFADGKVKGKSRPGRVKAAGASCKGSVTDLRAKAKKYSGEKGKMYQWCLNMKAGKK